VFVQRERPPMDLWAYVAHLQGRGRQIAIVVAGLILFAAFGALNRSTPATAEPEPDPDWDADTEVPAPRPRRSPPPAAVPQREPEPDATTPGRVLTGMGLPVGTPAPPFVLPDLAGRPHSLDDLRSAGKPLLLVFSNPHCGACRKLSPRLPTLAAENASHLTMALITREGAEEHLTPTDAGPLLLFQRDGEVTEAYDCTTIPCAVIVSPDGVIRTPPAIGGPDIESLVTSVRNGAFE
jgi:thiol-disulfide isomerase/thioredoxin